jgi:hypothetical protein
MSSVAMPRYFFHIYHDTSQPDFVGEELPDQHAAGDRNSRQMIQNIDGRLKAGHDWKMEVTDEFANVLYVIQVSARTPK